LRAPQSLWRPQESLWRAQEKLSRALISFSCACGWLSPAMIKQDTHGDEQNSVRIPALRAQRNRKICGCQHGAHQESTAPRDNFPGAAEVRMTPAGI